MPPCAPPAAQRLWYLVSDWRVFIGPKDLVGGGPACQPCPLSTLRPAATARNRATTPGATTRPDGVQLGDGGFVAPPARLALLPPARSDRPAEDVQSHGRGRGERRRQQGLCLIEAAAAPFQRRTTAASIGKQAVPGWDGTPALPPDSIKSFGTGSATKVDLPSVELLSRSCAPFWTRTRLGGPSTRARRLWLRSLTIPGGRR